MYQERLRAHKEMLRMVAELENKAYEMGELLVKRLQEGRKILACGNGGSAADAQHFAAEVVGRFQEERRAWPAIALTTDTSVLTAVGNDYGFDRVFARQVEALGEERDVLVGLSTSGNSTNVMEAVRAAKGKGMTTFGILGGSGGRLKDAVDHALLIPEPVTARVQEGHLFLIHYLAEHIETRMGAT